MNYINFNLSSKVFLCVVSLILGSACSQDDALSTISTQENTAVRVLSNAQDITFTGTLALPLETSRARALQYDQVSSASTAPIANTGAFKGKFEVGKNVKVWTIIKSTSQSKPLFCEEIDWKATAEGRLEPVEGLIRLLAPAGTPTTDWTIGGFIVGSSGVAGQVFSFDKETLRLNITTPNKASDHLDHKASELNKTGITGLPTIYTFGWTPISVTQTSREGKPVYQASFGTMTLAPRGTVLRLLSFVDLNYNLFTRKTKSVVGEPSTEAELTTVPLEERIELNKRALAEANRLTKGTAYIEPIRGVLKGVKDGYIDFSQDQIPFVSTGTHDFEIPTIEEPGTKYNPLVSTSADGANAKRGVLYLWVASEEGRNTSAEYQLETEFISYLTTDKVYDDVGTDPKYPGTQGTYWTETRQLTNNAKDIIGNPYPEIGLLREDIFKFSRTKSKTLSFGIWNELRPRLEKWAASLKNGVLDWELRVKQVKGNGWYWNELYRETYRKTPVIPELPHTMDYTVHFPRYDTPTKRVLTRTLPLQKGRSVASYIIYSVILGEYEGYFTPQPAMIAGHDGWGHISISSPSWPE